MSKPEKEKVLRWVEGQRVAAAFACYEKRERLASMTREQSLAEFNDLCSIGRPLQKDEQRRLDRIKLKALVRIREVFRRVDERTP